MQCVRGACESCTAALGSTCYRSMPATRPTTCPAATEHCVISLWSWPGMEWCPRDLAYPPSRPTDRRSERTTADRRRRRSYPRCWLADCCVGHRASGMRARGWGLAMQMMLMSSLAGRWGFGGLLICMRQQTCTLTDRWHLQWRLAGKTCPSAPSAVSRIAESHCIPQLRASCALRPLSRSFHNAITDVCSVYLTALLW